MLINILHNISSVILLSRLETASIQFVKISNHLFTIQYSFQLKLIIESIFICKTLNIVQSKTFSFLQPSMKLSVLFYPSEKKVISKDFLKLLFIIKVSKFYFCFQFHLITIYYYDCYY